MKLKKGKKATFDVINAGMTSFIMFILIGMLVVLLVQVTKTTDIICGGSMIGDTCYSGCGTNYTLNVTSLVCCNNSNTGIPLACNTENTTALLVYDSAAYNATVDMQNAAALPPQFAQIIVIVVIIVGILGMLAFVGYGVYKRMRD